MLLENEMQLYRKRLIGIQQVPFHCVLRDYIYKRSAAFLMHMLWMAKDPGSVPGMSRKGQASKVALSTIVGLMHQGTDSI